MQEGLLHTPLASAAQNGHTETVQVLLANGANPNAQYNYVVLGSDESYEKKPLHLAASNGHTETVKVLLKAGADFRATNGANKTALCLAAGKGHIETVKALLGAGANEITDIEHLHGTSLHSAASEGQTEIVQVLIAAGMDPSVQNHFKDTPLHFAASEGHTETVQALLSAGADPDVVNRMWDTPLNSAATNGHTETVQALLTAGAKFDNANTPVHSAATKGHTETVQALLAAGADPNAHIDGRTPLHCAAMEGHPEIVQVLLTAGATLDARDDCEIYKNGNTALHWASTNGHTETVQVLLTAGADRNAQNNEGNTALHVAVTTGRPQYVSELLKTGADSSIKNNDGQMAAELSGLLYGSQQRTAVLNVFKAYKGKECDVTPYIPFIAERVGSKWRDLAGRLGFSADDIDGFAASLRSDGDQASCRNMLEQWQQIEEDEGILKLQVVKAALLGMELQDVTCTLQTRLDAVVRGQAALVLTADFLVDNLDRDTVTHFMENRGLSSKHTPMPDLVNALVDCIKAPEDYEDLLQSLVEGGQAFLSKEIRSLEWKTADSEDTVVSAKPHIRGTVKGLISKEKTKALSPTQWQLGRYLSRTKQRIKLILLGETGCGKTSLCLTMILGQAHLVEESDRTIGVDILSYIDEKHGIEYKIYDFGGHNVYHYTHRFFLTHLGLYLLCVDLPDYKSGELQERVGKWMTSISSHVTKPALIVVGTKTDEGDVTKKKALLRRDIKFAETAVRQSLQTEISRCQETLDNREQGIQPADDHFVGLSREEILRKKLSLQKLLDGRSEDLIDVHIVPVSSKRNEGIDVLRRKMAHIVQERLTDSYTGVGKEQAWSNFENIIHQETSKTYLNLEECKQLGEAVGMKSDDVLNALEYLHVTGEILFYRHIQGMEDKVFPDPDIILKLFKQLFRHDMAEHIQKAEKLLTVERTQFLDEGVLSDEFVDAVLPEQAESFRLLLPLMKHFGLCFNRTVTMMANVPNAEEEEVAARWHEVLEEGEKEIKVTMKSLDVNSEHPIGLGESLACRIVQMSEGGRRLVKRNAVINNVGNMDVMYRRVLDEKKTLQKGQTDTSKMDHQQVDEIYLRTEGKQAWRRIKDLVKKIKPCLEEYRTRISEDRVTVTGDKKVASIPLEALHKHTGEDLDKIFLGQWQEPIQQRGVPSADKANKYIIDSSLYDLSSKLGENWTRLATELQLKRLDIEVTGLSGVTQRVFRALQLWRDKSGHGPLHYLPQLIRALDVMRKHDLALDVQAVLKDYRHRLPLITVNPEKTSDGKECQKWSLPHEGKFFCKGADLRVITPYPLYVTSVLWSGEPWTHGLDCVPMGPQFRFQFRCDDAKEPVEIDLPLIVSVTGSRLGIPLDPDVKLLCMDYDKDAFRDEVLFESRVKGDRITAHLTKDARVGPVGELHMICEGLKIERGTYGPSHDLKDVEKMLASMGWNDQSLVVRRMFQEKVSSMEKIEIQPDVSTDEDGVTKFRMTLPTGRELTGYGKYICKETGIGIVTSWNGSWSMTMTYETRYMLDQWEHQDDFVPVGPTFSIHCDVPEDMPVEILLPHILHLSKDDVMKITEEEAKVVHVTDKKEELLPAVITPTHLIFRHRKGSLVWSVIAKLLGRTFPRKCLFAMFRSPWTSNRVDMKVFIVSNTKGVIKTLQDAIKDLCGEHPFSLLDSRACVLVSGQTYCLHVAVENGTLPIHNPMPPKGIPYEDTLDDSTYPQTFELTIQRSSDDVDVKLDVQLRAKGSDDDNDDVCQMTKFIASADTVKSSHTKDRSAQGASSTDPHVSPIGTLHLYRVQSVCTILFVNDRYGTSINDISIVSCELAQLLTQAGADVYFTVLSASPEDKRDAEKHRVNLITPFQEKGDTREPSLKWLEFEHEYRYPNLPTNVDCIIGHVDITDEAAESIKDERYPKAQVVTVNHVIPKVEWNRRQNPRKPPSVFDEAKTLISVGHPVYKNFQNYGRRYHEISHDLFLPRPPQLFADTTVKPATGKNEEKVLLTTVPVKDMESLCLVAEAIGEVAEVIRDVRWHARCIGDVDHETAMKTIEDHLQRSKLSKLMPTLLPCGTQEDLRGDIRTAHLVLVPYHSEPFGIVGLAAIAAGVPVLISDNSGLAELIKDLIIRKKCHPDHRHRLVTTGQRRSPCDAKKWAKRIKDTLEHIEAEFENAAKFKQELMDSKYWEESHKVFIEKCGISAT
ncbi:PREDICTED: uncharacterized protein LOC109464149 [Branchiostoma belcheri]|uniref:Uncharacterized protein LOC109464149 n=1 Tax=Branchiostoma belcheri TaxID=7741 RepID=A0A6P4YI00_BRABE|nr:PREDICTED: uncharacterized protein LOC109464149 [Branchiostoma belcheri]